MRLFISYPRKNKTETLRLLKILKNGGHDVWIDDDLRTGQTWREQLREAIAGCDAIVLALTQNWLNSPYCNLEFMTAIELGKKVVPVLIKKNADGSIPKVPERIGKYQWTDFTAGFRQEARVQKFLNDLADLAVLVPRAPDDAARASSLAEAAKL